MVRTHSHNGYDNRPVLITGGAGFIGTNLAHYLLSARRRVILYDNLSRPGVEQNLAWLKATHGDLVRHEQGDVRDIHRLRKTVRQASQVFHFAAQVAVTTSLVEPTEDFEINARGTLNLLEALRSLEEPPPLVFTSTNKVYGDLNDVRLRQQQQRYEPEDAEIRTHGFNESCPLNFHSPYGCSKGAACQYVQDYARTFGLPTVVFRMSCIYGPHQFGTEDQGWVAHFLIKAIEKSPLTIYGDGRQVRDILYVEDLVQAFVLAQQNIKKVSGQVFNMGGGPEHTTSLLELVDLITELHGRSPEVRFSEWRAADQQYYVSDTRKFSALTGWRPKVGVRAGVQNLYHWLLEFHKVRTERILNLKEVVSATGKGVTSVSSRSIRPRTAANKGSQIGLKSLGAASRNGGSRKSKLAKAA
ncbi:MAG TPA: NAD-dependent epimerase/dehydratase family protein [Clostridia bacterium]|nr:NAD-dependent epimerase/dehydratase family protein [Clostridia bacterium]